MICPHCQHPLDGHTHPVPYGDNSAEGAGCAAYGCACIVDDPNLPIPAQVGQWHPIDVHPDHLAGCNACLVRAARHLEASSNPTLTVGDLRRVIDGLPDDTPVAVSVGTDDDSTDARALAAWVQASDAVPADLGGTDPMTEATRGVLFVQSWRYVAIERECVVCGKGLSWDALKRRYQHADGRIYRHNPKPRPTPPPPAFQLADWVQIDTITPDADEGSRMADWLRRRFGRTR